METVVSISDLEAVEKTGKIGMMTDSHGKPAKITAALDFFKSNACDRVFHLGDICDSAHSETVEACVRPLQESAVTAIRGNNDHLIIVNHRGLEGTFIPSEILNFLQALPLVVKYRNAVLAHSLPFARELGLSCMIGAMAKVDIERFMMSSPRSILFRGHSHSPEVFWKRDNRIRTRSLSIGEKLDLSGLIPCVVTCGALTDGFCTIWKPEENAIECSSFE